MRRPVAVAVRVVAVAVVIMAVAVVMTTMSVPRRRVVAVAPGRVVPDRGFI